MIIRRFLQNSAIKQQVPIMNSLSQDISPSIRKEIETLANRPQTGVSLKTLFATGRGELLNRHPSLFGQSSTPSKEMTLIQIALFLHHELPVRLAHRVLNLDQVPYMRDMPSVKAVKQAYVNSFNAIRTASLPDTPAKEEKFFLLLREIYDRHSHVLLTMARGAHELRMKMKEIKITTDFYEQENIHYFLDNFFLSRIGIRMLIGQYLAVRNQDFNINSDFIGMVKEHTSPSEIALHAIDDAKYICEKKHGISPEVTLHGRTDLTFVYVPTHLHYILVELLKNSVRATVEHHQKYGSELPSVKVIISDGTENEDVVIKISDEGGGIKRSNMNKIWSYLFTTADQKIQQAMINNLSDFDRESPLAGLGYGLPISRNYARYFGGDLMVMSVEGYGTDAYVHLNRLGDSDEVLC